MILLLCLVSAVVLVSGCTTQTSGPVTTQPAATVIPQSSSTVAVKVRTTLTLSQPPVTESLTAQKTGTPTTVAGDLTVLPALDTSEKVRIKARNFAFDNSRITVPAGAQVIVEFENEDSAPHNVAFYTTPSLTATIYKGKLIDGPGKITYVFSAPSTPGTYFFRCDLHPYMKGEFVVT